MPRFRITENSLAAARTYRMTLQGDVMELPAGSFVEVAVPDCYLRRPISVCASRPGEFTLLYKVVGKGTATMAQLTPGQEVDVITGLGNGFDLSVVQARALLLGGGIGTAPLYQLAVQLKERGIATTLIAGFGTREEIFWEEEFTQICDKALFATLDGSSGHKGLVTEFIAGEQYDHFFACGPMPMLKAVSEQVACEGQLSLEARMGCGFGICMGCSIETHSGPKRVCKEGPVFRKEELIW